MAKMIQFFHRFGGVGSAWGGGERVKEGSEAGEVGLAGLEGGGGDYVAKNDDEGREREVDNEPRR